MKRIIILLILLGSVIPSSAIYRVWGDDSGNYLEAELVGIQGKQIILKQRDGATVPVPLTFTVVYQYSSKVFGYP